MPPTATTDTGKPLRIERFADLKTLYAEMTATPEFQAAFGDPLALSIVEPGEQPGEYEMPEPFAAQAECGGIVATIFDLFTGTRLEPLAADEQLLPAIPHLAENSNGAKTRSRSKSVISRAIPT